MSWKPSRVTGTLFAQVLGLTLVVLCLAEAINMLIVFNLPPPTPVFFTQTEIEQALKRGPQAPRTADQLIVRAIGAPAQAQFEHPGQVHFHESLARDLGVAPGALVINSSSTDRYTIRVMHNVMRAAQNQVAQGQNRPEGFLIAPFKLDYRRPDGQWVEAVPPRSREWLEPWQQHVLIWFGLSFLAVAPFSYLFAGRLASPFTFFAAAADRLGRDPRAPPLSVPLRGGAEIRMATKAFNDMQERLKRYVEDRTSMVGAIAHDLRTPLTRLRFRVEAAPEELREKMTADIDQMEAMIAATLAFVRDTANEPRRTKLELSSLLESITDDMAETGADVRIGDVERVVINADSLALRRLFSNLMENAVKFGGTARASLFIRDQAAVVEVQDDGPGVPEGELERVFAPFYRREPSRNRKTGGIGLGLSVARSIARSHGGEVVLENRPGGGLTARATLPV
jgi:two-component system OmpR family sensor kinase